MNRTPFYRVLAIYVAGLALLALYFAVHHRVAQSAKKAVSFVAHAVQIQRAYAPSRDDETALPRRAQEEIQKSFPLSPREQRTIEVHNIFGSIEVVGGSGN